jgi:hypothetical protein
MTALEQLKFALRSDHRVKENVDYAIVFKYDKYHLVCATVWHRAIQDLADHYDIRFATVHTYTP